MPTICASMGQAELGSIATFVPFMTAFSAADCQVIFKLNDLVLSCSARDNESFATLMLTAKSMGLWDLLDSK